MCHYLIEFCNLLFQTSFTGLIKFSISCYRYHQHSKLKRVKSYGDGIYYNDHCEPFQNDTYGKENVQGSNSFSRAIHSNCSSCQKQLREEIDRNSCFQPQSISFEDQDSSLSMLLWDQNNHKSICHTYDSIPASNESKQNIGMVFNIIGCFLMH